MAIAAVALFGSRARGDQSPDSDTDLLLVSTQPGQPLHTSMGPVSLSTYGINDLTEKAENGDLFVWHCLFEGRAIHDPEHVFDGLRARFRLRSSYELEIGHGAALAWLLVRFGRTMPNAALAARRATWAVRTILIARSAEYGSPKFSAHELETLAPIDETPRLMQLKNTHVFDHSAAKDLRHFLEWCDLADPVPDARVESDFDPLFIASGNSVGLHLLSHSHEDRLGYG